MKLKPFSRKQLEVIATSNARINILTGPVRSGKTASSIVRWIDYIKNAPDGDLLMSGKTKHTIRRNVLQDMFTFIGSDNYKYNSTNGVIDCFGRTIHVVGANDERAEEKIRGMTIAGWYDDETTLKPESFFKQALARMSVAGAKGFLTTNPDSPYHWLKTEYMDNPELAGIVKTFYFQFDDNLSLDDEYKDSLKKLYTGLWYKRMILGLWVIAEGAIYDMFSEDVHVVDKLPETFERYYVGVDFGMSNATVFLLIGLCEGKYYLIKEYYYDGRARGRQKSVPEFGKDFKQFIAGIAPSKIFIDPSAAPLKVQLRNVERIPNIAAADNDVNDGIAAVASALATNKLYVYGPGCPNTIKEFMSYVWDPKAQKQGEDKPLKQFDHAMDALRYPMFKLIGKPHIGPVNKPSGA